MILCLYAQLSCSKASTLPSKNQTPPSSTSESVTIFCISTLMIKVFSKKLTSLIINYINCMGLKYRFFSACNQCFFLFLARLLDYARSTLARDHTGSPPPPERFPAAKWNLKNSNHIALKGNFTFQLTTQCFRYCCAAKHNQIYYGEDTGVNNI